MIRLEKKKFPVPANICAGNSLEELIALGRYDIIDKEIVSDVFLLPDSQKQSLSEINIELAYCLERFVSVSDFVRALQGAGFYPLGIRELLSFGIKYPDIQLRFPIMEVADTGLKQEECTGIIYKHKWRLYLFKKLYESKKRSLYVSGAGDLLFRRHERIIVAKI